MAHRHTIGFRMTGPDMPAGRGLHTHELPGGGRTSADAEGPRHTHTTPSGQKTGGPLPIGDDEEDEQHSSTKKKRKKKKKWKY